MKSRFFLWWIVLCSTAGCGHFSYLPPAPDPTVTLAPAFSIPKSPAFQRALKSEPQSLARQKARIDYLLEVVSHSPYNFIRSGSRYTGKRTEAHLRWKYYRNRWQVKTAEEFIDHVSSASKVTGQPYLVEFHDKDRYPLRLLLARELERFDRELGKEDNPPLP